MNFKSIACGAFQDPLDKNDVGQILPLFYVWVNADGLIRTGETSHKKNLHNEIFFMLYSEVHSES